MTVFARRPVRVLLYVLFGLLLATTLLTLFLGGPAEIGIPTGILAVLLGGFLDSTYFRRKQ